MKIASVEAFPLTHQIPKDQQIRLGVGTTRKRDTILVRVRTDDGAEGWGEAHHMRCPGAVAHLINTSIRELVVGMDAGATVEVAEKVYRRQMATHGMGPAAATGLSAIDLALWDIRGKQAGLPLYRLLGGSPRPIPAYAGGLALGYQQPSALVDEATELVEAGFSTIKLRIGDSPERDLERVFAVRDAFPDIEILTDVNAAYTLEEVRLLVPDLEEAAIGWLEEPFAAHDFRSYRAIGELSDIPLAAGENHYLRFDFDRLIDDGAITVLQPDVSKCGGITEAMRIAALASAARLRINPHTSMTGINMAATIHYLAALDCAGYFEADVSRTNPFREQLTSRPYDVSAAGTVVPLEAPGIGVEVDVEMLAQFPIVEGPSYI